MRANLEDNTARRLRQNSTKFGTTRQILVGDYTITVDGPTFHFLDAGASPRTIHLPVLDVVGGQYYAVMNVGTQSLNVVDAGGVAILTIGVGSGAFILSSHREWSFTLSGNGAVSYRIVTMAGNITVLPSDTTILVNKTVGAPTSILLPTSASRNGVPITVRDYKGDANTNNITFVPNGAETIDGFSPAAAITNGSALIDINFGKKTLYPLTSGGWYL